jgi:hypothetical protein
MTILAVLLAAASPVYGTDVPDNFRRGEVGFYIHCLRDEVNAAGTTWKGADPAAPTVVKFAQLMEFCGPERKRGISMLRGLIRTRNPSWPSEQVERSAEFVLTGLELQLMLSVRWPTCAPSEMPCVEF